MESASILMVVDSTIILIQNKIVNFAHFTLQTLC